MKKTSLAALILICLSAYQILYAQQEPGPAGKDASNPHKPKGEFRIGYGLLSDMQLIAAFTDTYVTIASGITGEPIGSDYPTVGPIIAGYSFFLSDRISLGPEFNIIQLDIKSTYSSGEVTRDQFLITNLSARVDFYYVQNEKIELYSGASLGGSYIFEQSADPDEENNSSPFVSYHLNFFGVRFGKSWAGFAEAGFGRNGLMNFGVTKRL
jgi:hypothetical protein